MIASLRCITCCSIPRKVILPNAKSAFPVNAPGPHTVREVVVVYNDDSNDDEEESVTKDVSKEANDEEQSTFERPRG
jgi:hypothetical protein